MSTTEERHRERSEELERRRPALEALEAEDRELEDEIRGATASEAAARERLESLHGDLEAARAASEAAVERLRRARERAADLEGRLATARARASGLASLVASSALLPETVARLLEERADLPGVEGALSEFLETPAEWASAVESLLGPYLHGVVVSDWGAVGRVEAWLEARGADEGVLLLPLDPGPAEPDEGVAEALLERVTARGPGAPWVRALLAGVEVEEGGSLPRRRGPWVGPDGKRQDRWGGVFLGRPGGGDGVLSRRAELEARRAEAVALESERAGAAAELARVEAEAGEARGAADRLELEVGDAEAERREAGADRAAAEARLERLRDERTELGGRIEQLEAFHESETARSETGEERGRELEASVASAEAERGAAEEAAESARQEAEAERTALHEAELRLARHDAELANRREASERTAESLEEAERRAKALVEEREQLESLVAESERAAGDAEAAIGDGLEERAERERRLTELEERIDARRDLLERREAALREARRLERERTDRRHALELEVTQLDAARGTVHERLQAEWDATLEELRARVEPLEEGDPEAWEQELLEVRRSLARIGPVNLLAQQEYEEEKTRLEFLTEQRDDLTGARDDLRSSIRRINQRATEAFTATFEQVREHFHRTFDTLFQGGECDLWLEDPEDPLDSPIEISASPRGKKTQRIHLLSGGERALTALALLFAIYLAKPSPFCLLDEVDAPLDETNILRFVGMLEGFKSDTQFIVITHNPRTMEGADWIYGVTMQEPGVSSIVGVEFDQATQVA